MDNAIKASTVTKVAKVLNLLAGFGDLSVSEEKEIVAQLRSLSRTGEQIPVVIPKLVDQTDAAGMLGISLANFKKIERNNQFPFKRKMIGSSVRYRNTDIVKFILSEDSLDLGEVADDGIPSN